MNEFKFINDAATLEDALSQPYPEDIEVAGRLGGDVLVLGAAGKMGPTLVHRVRKALSSAGSKSRVYAVSRFTDAEQKELLDSAGVKTVVADLLDEEALKSLPDCPYVIYMAGRKFGSSSREDLTWAMNAYLPGRVADRFKSSRIVAFSTGNVYPLAPVSSSGSKESDPPSPIGEYSQSCLGRERILEYFSREHSIPMCILRLNYAVEARYGVLVDIAERIWTGQPVSVTTGYFNVIWQGDANSVCLRAFDICKSPPEILNLTGPGKLSVRQLAEEFGRRFERPAVLEGTEEPTAFLSNPERCLQLFGPPRVSLDQVLDLVTHWIQIGGPTLNKPTKFEVRDGKF
ncbi:MAG: NAD-dependent epimerase/dehydratase family protein [Acidobacteriota bacterium]